jgi:hypothetical protein
MVTTDFRKELREFLPISLRAREGLAAEREPSTFGDAP